MPTWTDFFVRDSLNDDGTVPSPGYPYMSPDVICTAQNTYPDPTATFRQNYSSDPNQYVIANQQNYFYVRAQNRTSSAQARRAFLYWSTPSLLMMPSQWLNNVMYVEIPGPDPIIHNYLDLPQVPPANDTPGGNLAAVSVSSLPFIWNTSGPAHLCTVLACINTNETSWAGPNTATWRDFTYWVRTNQNVSWRNYSLMTNPNIPEWNQTAVFDNSASNAAVPLTVKATYSNVPVNTVITLSCTAIAGFNKTQSASSSNGYMYANTVDCPANFSGYITTTAQAPNGVAWPANAMIVTEAWLGTAQGEHPVSQFAHDFGEENQHPQVLKAKAMVRGGNGVLIRVGSVGMGCNCPVAP